MRSLMEVTPGAKSTAAKSTAAKSTGGQVNGGPGQLGAGSTRFRGPAKKATNCALRHSAIPYDLLPSGDIMHLLHDISVLPGRRSETEPDLAMPSSLLKLLRQTALWLAALALYAGVFSILTFIILDFAEVLLRIDLVPEVRRHLGLGGVVSLIVALLAGLWFLNHERESDDV